MREVPLSVLAIDRFIPYIGEQRVKSLHALAGEIRDGLAGRAIWNVNSTEKGGGVAELLRGLVAYVRGTGIDARWGVITGPADFFVMTKRIHHALHGSKGSGQLLDPDARRLYERVLHENLIEFSQVLRAGDFVILHDPQTAGLVPGLKSLGVHVIWRCHVGSDSPNAEVRRAWDFLKPYLDDADAFIFSRQQYVPEFIERHPVMIITPTIDPFSSKNHEMSEATVRAILVHTGIVEGPRGDGEPMFVRDDGTPGRVDRCADVIRLGPAPSYETPLVTQVSRWDRLKDPLGVLKGFVRLLQPHAPRHAQLVLAGPNVHAVADDPEGAEVFGEVLNAWRELPHPQRAQIHLVNLPMTDVGENAAIVNALQRHSALVVQKSLCEGFGLTVAEAMWKGRPVVASAVGGILDQIEDGKSGLLLPDATDLRRFSELIEEVLHSPDLARSLGVHAHLRVRDHFLGLSTLEKYAALVHPYYAGKVAHEAAAAQPAQPAAPAVEGEQPYAIG